MEGGWKKGRKGGERKEGQCHLGSLDGSDVAHFSIRFVTPDWDAFCKTPEWSGSCHSSSVEHFLS